MSDNPPPPPRRPWLIPTYIAGVMLLADFVVDAMGKESGFQALRPFLLGGGLILLVVAAIMARRSA